MNLTRLFLLTAIIMSLSFKLPAQIHFGVFADCQYCNCETAGSRFYRNSTVKLDECIQHFNQISPLAFVVGLGDLIDRDISSYRPLKAILEKSYHPVYNVPGNHDYEVEKTNLEKVPEKLGLTKKTYHTAEKGSWLFIFLNGNEITFQSTRNETIQKAKTILGKLKAAGRPNSNDWNGGMSEKQIGWLDRQLKKAREKKLKVAIFCHYPLLPLEAHTLWNSEEVLAVLEKYDHIKLYMNGHNHAGNYVYQNGIHFITLQGMVETETQNAFAEVTLMDDSIEIKGYGREETRNLLIQ